MPAGVGYPETPQANPFQGLTDFAQAAVGSFDPSIITPEAIEAMTVMMALLQAQLGMQQIAVQGEQNQLTRDQIAMQQEELAFRIKEQMPHERARMAFEVEMQKFRTQEAQYGVDVARYGVDAAKERTNQERFGTQRAQLDYQGRALEVAEQRRQFNQQLASQMGFPGYARRAIGNRTFQGGLGY